MQYITKAHSMFAWSGFICLLLFMVCLIFGDAATRYLYSIAGPTGLAGILLAIVLTGLATSLSTGLIAALGSRGSEPSPKVEKLPM